MSGTAVWLIAAVLVQGTIVFVLAVLLYQARIPLVVRGRVRIPDVALNREAWPDWSRQVANAFSNQFELPVLFYVAALLSLHLAPTLSDAVLAWLFVVSRGVHAFIHVTTNHVVRRFSAYVAGAVILAVWWLVLSARLLIAATAGGVA